MVVYREDLRVDVTRPIFEGDTYDFGIVVMQEDGQSPEDLTSATWISCALFDEDDDTLDVRQLTLAGGVTKTDPTNGKALARFSTTDTAGLITGRRKLHRRMRYAWKVIKDPGDGERTKTVAWGYINVVSAGSAS